MSDAPPDDKVRNKVAVRLPANETHAEKLRECLASRGWHDAERFLPKDDDELNDRLCRGEFSTVVFATPEDAMAMIWSGHGAVSRWQASEGRLKLHFAAGVGDGADWPAILRRAEVSFSSWEKGRRRRQVVAGSILTAIALTAMALFLWSRG